VSQLSSTVRYLQGLGCVIFIEHKRKDYWEMITHHLAT
jgi:hypothetical protein